MTARLAVGWEIMLADLSLILFMVTAVTLSQTGDGSYGNLTVAWKLGGKHSLFWKNEGGRTRIYDGQSGEEITQSPSKTRSFMDFVNLKTITYNRLDNCEPTTYALAAVERPKKT